MEYVLFLNESPANRCAQSNSNQKNRRPNYLSLRDVCHPSSDTQSQVSSDANFSQLPLSLTLITIFILIYCQITQVVLSDTGISKEYVNGCIIQARIDKLNQENILSHLAKSDGNIRILIATIAYEMRVYSQWG